MDIPIGYVKCPRCGEVRDPVRFTVCTCVQPNADPTPASAVARQILARLETQQVKGRITRAKHATDMAIGAAMAALAIGGPESADYKSLSLVAYMVAIRGEDYLQELTK